MILQHFNQALDDLKGNRTEVELAGTLGISKDTIADYRRSRFPRNVLRIFAVPALMAALARDFEQPEPAKEAQ
jgi:hypothetical protein